MDKNKFLLLGQWFWVGVTLLYAGLIMSVSFKAYFSGEGVSLARQTINNFLHAPGYAVLACLVYMSIDRKNLVLAGFMAVVYGVMMEIGQIYIPGRSFSMEDIVVNSLGVVFGLVVFNKTLNIIGN